MAFQGAAMGNLLLIDDDPKLIASQIGHALLLLGVQIDVAKSRRRGDQANGSGPTGRRTTGTWACRTWAGWRCTNASGRSTPAFPSSS